MADWYQSALLAKKKSTVAVRRPGREIVVCPFEVRHTEKTDCNTQTAGRGYSGRNGTHWELWAASCVDTIVISV